MLTRCHCHLMTDPVNGNFTLRCQALLIDDPDVILGTTRNIERCAAAHHRQVVGCWREWNFSRFAATEIDGADT